MLISTLVLLRSLLEPLMCAEAFNRFILQYCSLLFWFHSTDISDLFSLCIWSTKPDFIAFPHITLSGASTEVRCLSLLCISSHNGMVWNIHISLSYYFLSGRGAWYERDVSIGWNCFWKLLWFCIDHKFFWSLTTCFWCQLRFRLLFSAFISVGTAVDMLRR